MLILKEYPLLKLNNFPLFIIIFTLYSCQKENVTETLKPLTINRIFSEETYDDHTKVYTNDSLFCLYPDGRDFKVWKNGILMKDHKSILPLIKGNDSAKIFRTYKFQSELMKLDFNNYSDKTVNRDTKDYQIRKKGKDYFLYKKGYRELRLPVRHFESMDWITFNSMDINNDQIPELFIFNEAYNDREDLEYGKMTVYEIK
ncbi:hypothetical protein [Chryseobacterium arthrosphaerae]|uniref:Uncharacterized protein n=1 Tax=Chryseobacterium arthrosphaerae TaxID=651561 RepID=A0A1B8ZIM3_9FLAO|nr:hypothetical protein [Chryseobacterium arthrosphaerae]OCA71452.1 hypothetical protein BBI00_17200 [Chryseobacterium arthrosphaerae]